MPTNLYGLGTADFLTGTVKSSDTWHCMLFTNSYAPNFDTDHYVSTPRTNEVVGTGYTADGATVAFTAPSYVVAASAAVWTVATVYALGEIVRKVTTNGHVYRCVVAGTSHASVEPTWPTTPGTTVTDGTVTWAECGRGYVKLAFTPANVSWATATITARYLVVADFTPGTDATRQLLACIDLRNITDPSSTAGAFTVTFDAQGLLLLPIPS